MFVLALGTVRIPVAVFGGKGPGHGVGVRLGG